MAVAIVVDSASDLPDGLVESRGIRRVPLSIRFGEVEYADGVDLSREKFWSLMETSLVLPQTAAPSPADFQGAFQGALEDGADAVVCLTMSADLSATYQAATLAAKEFDALPVRVIDTRTLTLTEGLIALGVEDKARSGASLDEVIEWTHELCARSRTMGALDTLENLRKGGRIGTATAMIGTVMSFKPMIEVVDGLIEARGRQRTRRRAIDALTSWVEGLGAISQIGLVHALAVDAQEVSNMLSDRVGVPVITSVMGATIGTHAGPGALGVSVILGESESTVTRGEP
ncbi:MAG: DegV family protein [Ferrimicrobium sp.]